MPRRMIIQSADSVQQLLTETQAESEEQLQELVKENPDLLPIEEFGMTGPLMVVGRETGLPSGAVDLVALARSGELLVVEFKTGPQNSDFRAALSQLVDYGSDLWRRSFDEFEQAVALRYFASERCRDENIRGKRSLQDAAQAIWTDLTEEELSVIPERIGRQLADGSLHYVLVAQRFTETMERTMDYLNSITPAVSFWAVELVRFTGDGMSAFETRTLLKPKKVVSPSAARIDEAELLEKVQDSGYREALHDLLDASRGLGYRLGWGSSGVSIRLPTPDRQEPLTVAWLFPPGVSGWMGLTDLTLGVDRGSSVNTPSAQPALEDYLAKAKGLPAVERVTAQNISAYHVPPDAAVRLKSQITELLAELARRVGESSG